MYSYQQGRDGESVPLTFAPLEFPPRDPPRETDSLLSTPVHANCCHEHLEKEPPLEENDDQTVSTIFGKSMIALFVIGLLVASGAFSLPRSGRFFFSNRSETAVFVPRLSSSKTELPKPTDQIQRFLQLWQKGRCDEELKDLLASSFEFQVTTFGEEDDEKPLLVYDTHHFIKLLCEPYAGHFVLELEPDHHNNLGSNFGTLLGFGADYYALEGQDAPCLAPFYATFAVTLNGRGRIELLQELVHNVETYNEFTEECLRKMASDAAAPKRRLLSHKKQKKEPMTNVDIVLTVFNNIWMGQCEQVRPYLAPNFQFKETIFEGSKNAEEFVEACREMVPTIPLYMYPLISFADGTTATVTGPFVQMVGADCPVFGKESFLAKFTPDGLLIRLYGTVGDSYLEGFGACLEKQQWEQR